MFCVILFHNAHNVVFFARLVKRKKLSASFFELSVRANRLLVQANCHRAKRPVTELYTTAFEEGFKFSISFY